jgi:phosphotransferase system enzyme I (PtsI)
MKEIHGIGASGGIAMGSLALYQNNKSKVEGRHIKDIEGELARLEAAQKEAVNTLNEIHLQSLKRVGEKDSMIFEIHMMMIEDEDFSAAVREKIEKEQVNVEYAVWKTGNEFAERFAQMDDDYMRERKIDIIDISRRLIQCLDSKVAKALIHLDEPSIVAADDLTPSETMQLDKFKVLAIVTRRGSRTSHSAILSRTMGIPSIVTLEDSFSELKTGMFAVVDGSSGTILLEPDEATKKSYEKIRDKYLREQQELRQLLKTETVTKDGRKIEVNANIGHPSDVESALENGADGIGLFRSEFLYMERKSLPTEEEQFQAYKQVLEKMQGRSVIIRTFDIGADKQVSYLNLPQETNPAMGYRAIRICLDRKELFYTQLRALLRASTFGNLKIMFPMIISLDEVKAAKTMLEQAKSDLKAVKMSFAQNVKTGIMIETPAAVMLSEELAKECDFFSIGTNDLTQYTLAADRMNGNISKLYDQRHPAVLKMIEMAAINAKKAGIPVGICGESADDPVLTEFYLKIGVNEFSVASSSVLVLKKHICKMDFS